MVQTVFPDVLPVASILWVKISFINVVFYQFIMRKYIYRLALYYILCSIENLLNEIKKAFRTSLILDSKKYSGSHRKLRPAGAEYEINDGLLRNMAAHSGFPYRTSLASSVSNSVNFLSYLLVFGPRSISEDWSNIDLVSLRSLNRVLSLKQ